MNEKMDISDDSLDASMTDDKSKKAVFAVKVLRDGRVTIPEDQRKKLGIEVGDWIKLVMEKMEE
jgi:hypothetical protein